MSELQLGLLGLGAVVVVGVLVFNKVQELRARRDAAQRFGSSHEDVLLGGPGRTGEAQPGDGAPAAAGPAERIEPRWDDAAAATGAAGEPGAPAATAGATAVLDARIDFIAELAIEEPVLGSHVMLEAEKLMQRRNVDCDGFNEAARAWEGLNRDAVYERVRIGIQLSDRGGPLKHDELEAFQHGVAEMGKRLGAAVDWRGEQSPLTRAAELDAFCAGVDVLIGINVVAAAPFAETKLRGLAEANGFARDEDGVFRRRDEGQPGAELISLKGVEAGGSLSAVSLALDVPRVAREAAPFGLLTHCAKRLAAGLDGRLVDDNGKPLDDAGMAAIQSSLAGIYARMDAAGMPAGGALARRVFS